MIRGCDHILPGRNRASTLAQGQLSRRARSMSSGQSAISQWVGMAFPHRVLGGIDPRYHFFCPGLFNLQMYEVFLPGDGILFSPGDAGPRRRPNGQLPPRAGSICPIQLAISG